MTLQLEYEMAVIGSGFGGAILACRSARKWPGKVLLLERGKRYPMGSFPRSPHGLATNFWNLPSEDRARPRHVARQDELHGLFDIRNYAHLDAVLCAGLGGGSLIYANVFLEPPDEVFAAGWPQGWHKERLRPYYDVAKAVLGARTVPQDDDPRRRILRTQLFQQVAARQGRPFRLAEINVFFGNDHDRPLPIGAQELNRYGAPQTSCVYCGECDVGCNTHSKNTLDLNYLYVAERRYQAKVLTEHLATSIVPLGPDGADDPAADGGHGYRVHLRDLLAGKESAVLTRRVVVSAGAMGSTELLMRCRDIHRTLPRVSQALGRRFSANGDFLSFAIDGKKPADPNYGPVITCYTDHHLFEDFARGRAFILEDAAYPAFAAWFAEGARPGLTQIGTLWRALRHFYKRLRGEAFMGRIGFFLSDVLAHDLSYGTSVLLCMGLDRASGIMRLNRSGYLDIDWPYRDNLPLYEAVLRAAQAFGREVEAKAVVALPNWWWPTRNNITVHSLGGCALADHAEAGVASAAPGKLGQVFGYSGLYVADGAIVPTAIGANPTATIAALAEMVAEGITGIAPDAAL